jgi:hypothetical protein
MDFSPAAARGRGVLIVAAAVAVAAVVAAFLLLRPADGGRPSAGSAPTGIVSADGSAPSAEPLPPSAAPSSGPSVTPQATALQGTVFTADPKAVQTVEPVPVPQGYDGCDHDYGVITQCVPWRFPNGITEVSDKCEWLRLNGFHDLAVVGLDRQGLDADRNKIACDS